MDAEISQNSGQPFAHLGTRKGPRTPRWSERKFLSLNLQLSIW